MAQTKKKIIWVVEDDPATQRVISAHLSANEFEPVVFETAEKAYAALRAGQEPALMLVDIMLPGMSGVDLIRLIKQNKEWENIPVIVVTAMARPDAPEAAQEFELDTRWVNKPFDANDLVHTVQSILSAVK